MTDQRMDSDAPLTTARDDEARVSAAGDDGGAVTGRTVTIDRPREEIYAFWRDFSNLPAVLENVEHIDVIDAKRSHWVVKAPAGGTVEWDSLITYDEPGRLIAWQSVEGSDIRTTGRIEFIDAPPGRGTMVRAIISYDPPGGVLGAWFAKLFQREPALQARRDLRRLKQYLETGEVTTSAGPSGRAYESRAEQKL